MMHLPKNKMPGILGRLFHFARHIPRVYWLEALTVVLATFLTFLPRYTRTVFWLGLRNQGTLVIMLLMFCLLAISLVWSAGQHIDVWILMYFNMYGYRPLWLDWFMLAFTQIGNGYVTVVIAFFLFLGVNHLLAYELILGTILLWMVVELMKMIIQRNRPYIKLKKIRIVGVQASGRSFPSGHTSQTFFMATLLIYYFHTSVWVGILLYCIAGLVGITRMYVGMHYPRDVMAGAILGTVWGSIGAILIFV